MNFWRLKFWKARHRLNPRGEFKAALWRKLSAEWDARALPRPAWYQGVWFRFSSAVLAIVLVVSGFTTGAYAYVSPAVTEGTVLYSVKRALEKIEERLQPTSAAKARFYLKQMNRREAETLVLEKRQQEFAVAPPAPSIQVPAVETTIGTVVPTVVTEAAVPPAAAPAVLNRPAPAPHLKKTQQAISEIGERLDTVDKSLVNEPANAALHEEVQERLERLKNKDAGEKKRDLKSETKSGGPLPSAASEKRVTPVTAIPAVTITPAPVVAPAAASAARQNQTAPTPTAAPSAAPRPAARKPVISAPPPEITDADLDNPAEPASLDDDTQEVAFTN